MQSFPRFARQPNKKVMIQYCISLLFRFCGYSNYAKLNPKITVGLTRRASNGLQGYYLCHWMLCNVYTHFKRLTNKRINKTNKYFNDKLNLTGCQFNNRLATKYCIQTYANKDIHRNIQMTTHKIQKSRTMLLTYQM